MAMGLFYIEIKDGYDRCRKGMFGGGVREGIWPLWPPKNFTKEQTHLWAPYSFSRWITSADDNRGFTATAPFLLTVDLVLV